jgi:hypothetical protein
VAFSVKDSTDQCVLFASGFSRRLEARFDEPLTTSDGGATLLQQADASMVLTRRLAAVIWDRRCDAKVTHSLESLLQQRVFAIACGYADCNDSSRLRQDPMHRELCGAGEEALASQPTLSRFENQISRSSLLRMGLALTDTVIERLRRRHRRARTITLDLDSTVDPTHGRQQYPLFHGAYGTYCFLPQFCFASFDDDPVRYLLAGLLRKGTVHEVGGGLSLLRKTIARLRAAFPQARIRVRLDARFARVELLDLLNDLEVEYLVALSEHAVLERESADLVARARGVSEQTG